MNDDLHRMIRWISIRETVDAIVHTALSDRAILTVFRSDLDIINEEEAAVAAMDQRVSVEMGSGADTPSMVAGRLFPYHLQIVLLAKKRVSGLMLRHLGGI